jgi:hypothetical protein
MSAEVTKIRVVEPNDVSGHNLVTTKEADQTVKTDRNEDRGRPCFPGQQEGAGVEQISTSLKYPEGLYRLDGELVVGLYLDAAGRETARVHAFPGRQVFPLSDPVVKAVLATYLEENGQKVTPAQQKVLYQKCVVMCHGNGIRGKKDDWKEVLLDDNSLLKTLLIKSQLLKSAKVTSTGRWQKSLTTLANNEKLDASEWAEVKENVFSRLMGGCIEHLADLGSVLEKLKRNKKGSRWRLWPAGERPPSTPASAPLSTPESSSLKSNEGKDLQTMVQLDADLEGIARYLAEPKWEKFLSLYDRGRLPRHVLLVGPNDKIGPVAERLLDRGEEFQYRRFSGAELCESAVNQAQEELTGLPERILILLTQIDLVRPKETLLWLLNWAQATCVCTTQDRNSLDNDVMEQFQFIWTCPVE